jgi:hypothetical protein
MVNIMSKNIVVLVLFLAALLFAPICLAQLNQVWLPPSWALGSGYVPYNYGYYPTYSSDLWGWGFNPFPHYGSQGKTYNPYAYYSYSPYSYYGSQGKTYNPYAYYGYNPSRYYGYYPVPYYG